MEQVKGARAKVDMYFGKVRSLRSVTFNKTFKHFKMKFQGLGQLVLVHSGQPVLFHLGQVLTNQRPVLGLGSDQSEAAWAPYLETRTLAAVEWLLKPGTRVSLNARKIRGCYLPMQVCHS